MLVVRTKVPLAVHGRAIPRLFQVLCKRFGALAKRGPADGLDHLELFKIPMLLFVSFLKGAGADVKNPMAGRVLPAHDRRAGGSAVHRRRKRGSKSRSLGRKFIDMGRLIELAAVTPDARPAKIIGKYQDNVRFVFVGGKGGAW